MVTGTVTCSNQQVWQATQPNGKTMIEMDMETTLRERTQIYALRQNLATRPPSMKTVAIQPRVTLTMMASSIMMTIARMSLLARTGMMTDAQLHLRVTMKPRLDCSAFLQTPLL